MSASISDSNVQLYVMPGCAVCPQMKRLFSELENEGKVANLEIKDVMQHPEEASELNIRSVPFYLINGVAHSGLKSRKEVLKLLQSDCLENWQAKLRQQFQQGELDQASDELISHEDARQAAMRLLQDPKTDLVVRIGITAAIESTTDNPVWNELLPDLIKLAQHADARVAEDGLYYLSLLKSPQAHQELLRLSTDESYALSEIVQELLSEE